MDRQEIENIIFQSIIGEASNDEKQQLDIWLADDESNRRLYKRLIETGNVKDLFCLYTSADTENSMNQILGKDTAYHSRYTFFTTHFFRVAAVVALLIVGGAFWYHHEYTRVTPPEISLEVQMAMQQSQESGMQGADVVTSVTSKQQVITNEECDMYHVDDDFAEQLEEAKRITTYHNKEYWVTLEDGTLVHLNYNSRLIYPEKFGDRRDVILEGEAYFMVAHDKSRQFVVHTSQGDVKVYGTEFMVNTKDENGNGLSVVLVKGSVSFTPSNGQDRMMTPSQQLMMSDNEMTVRIVDTAPYVAWNTGTFVFEDATLEQLMNVLSQWFGIKQVNYSNDKLRKIHFTGNIKRYGSVKRMMEGIMILCDVQIDMDNDTIYIHNK